jgi:hypothetical protein
LPLLNIPHNALVNHTIPALSPKEKANLGLSCNVLWQLVASTITCLKFSQAPGTLCEAARSPRIRQVSGQQGCKRRPSTYRNMLSSMKGCFQTVHSCCTGLCKSHHTRAVAGGSSQLCTVTLRVLACWRAVCVHPRFAAWMSPSSRFSGSLQDKAVMVLPAHLQFTNVTRLEITVRLA